MIINFILVIDVFYQNIVKGRNVLKKKIKNTLEVQKIMCTFASLF